MARHRTEKRAKPSAYQRQVKHAAAASSRSMDRAPKSMVVRVGVEDVGRSVRQLVLDMRQVMQPDTAARLKERRKNRLRDFTTMAGPLGVTHLLLFSRSERGTTNMRLAIAPRGPTLNFRVESYSLCDDVMKSQRHPKGFDGMHVTPPLLIMNNFMTTPKDAEAAGGQSKDAAVPRHLESLVTTVFQSLFPPVSPQTMPLSSVKRVLLLNREPPSDSSNGAYTMTLRHYAITTKSTGLPKVIKRINAAEKARKNERKGKGVPDLGQLEDVADYLLDGNAGNYTSASESEPDTEAEVEILAQRTRKLQHKDKAAKKKDRIGGTNTGASSDGTQKRAIKLTELGPRMRLRLLKIEEGLCEGKVMWHESIHKSKEEEQEMEAVWAARKKEKEERKKKQRENIERRKKEKEARKANGEEIGDDDDDFDDELEDYDDWENDDVDDDAMDEDNENEEAAE